MRIVHISTQEALGGAARAALRLHLALRAAGADSSMLVRWKTSKLDSVIEEVVPEQMPSWWGDLVQAAYIDRNRSAVSNTFFSLGWPGHDLSNHPAVRQADVIHLHWISCFQSPATVGALLQLGKPVVWTLHDQRAFTGGCHFAAGCRKYESTCSRCPQLESDPARLPAGNLGEQARHYAVGGKILVVAPSQWMAECARRSAVFRDWPVEVVPNGVDAQTFQPMPAAEARQRLGVPEDGLQLLVGMGEPGERRKGLAELTQALETALRDPGFARRAAEGKIRLLTFGGAMPGFERLKIPVQAFGHLDDDAKLRLLYCAANAHVLPSIEDNLPNTALESMSCARPVVGFRIGGIPDLVREGETGRLARGGDVAGLARILCALPEQIEQLERMGAACRQSVEQNFTTAQQAETCLRLYRRQIERQPPATSASPAAPRAMQGAQFTASFARALKWALRRPPELFDVLDCGTSDPVEGRFRRERVCRLMRGSLDRCAAGKLPFADLVAQLDRDLASLAAPIETRDDRRRLAWLKFKLKWFSGW